MWAKLCLRSKELQYDEGVEVIHGQLPGEMDDAVPQSVSNTT